MPDANELRGINCMNAMTIFEDRKICVTGGAGFSAPTCVSAFSSGALRCSAWTTLRSGDIQNIAHLQEHPGFSFLHWDVEKRLPGNGARELGAIYNLACPASPPDYQRDPVQTFRTSVLGAMNLLELPGTIEPDPAGLDLRGLRRSPPASAAGKLLGARQYHRPPLLL